MSEPPCGDSSMLKLNENQNYWTGAKAIEGKNEE